MIKFRMLNDIMENAKKEEKRTLARLLSEAINDWPDWRNGMDKDTEIGEYFNEVKFFLRSDSLRKTDVIVAMKKLSPAKDSWRMESLAVLEGIFDFLQCEEIDPLIIENILTSDD